MNRFIIVICFLFFHFLLNGQCPAPTPIVSDITLCAPGTAILQASGSNGIFNWYANSNGTNLIGTGNPFTTTQINSTTTFYLQTINNSTSTSSQQFYLNSNVQTFTAPITGTYTIQCWGAWGGSDCNNHRGRGAYATGTINLNAGQQILIYVGGAGLGCNVNSGGGWNGGGNAGPIGCSGGGGGASDVRFGGNNLSNRIIVASGGGGAGCSGGGGDGGGLNGLNGSGVGGSQVSGGGGTSPGSLGQGGNRTNGDGGGGGGGYYGGGAAYQDMGGGGGSSFIGGVSGGSMIAGNQSMPNPDGGTMTGNSNNGRVIISWPNTCLSSIVPVTVNIVPLNTGPTVQGTTLCSPGSASLQATSPQGTVINWFANPNGTGLLGTGNNFTTPILNSTTTYYVQYQTGSGLSGSQMFNFNGNSQNFIAPTNGTYTIRSWGAKGGDDGMIGGKGGFAEGSIQLNAGQTLTVNVGGMGATCAVNSGGGWNGGGNAGSIGCSGGGGGASDVRMGGNALSNRIIVAGGGGGAGCCGLQAGVGGGLSGSNGSGIGGSQISGGGGNNSGSLGIGGN